MHQFQQAADFSARTAAGSFPALLSRRFTAWLALFLCTGCSPANSAANRVVVYCALDREFADPILDDFSKATGLQVVRRYDTEANKSVGLFEDLRREAAQPRCDVHWNNEILATIRLQRQGILQPYHSPSAQGFPDRFKDTAGAWTAFAARVRVLIINTEKVGPDAAPRGLWDLTLPAWKGRVAMAKPMFGTTATQGAFLFQSWGPVKAKDFFLKLNANEVRIVAGNKQVAVGVGAGQFDVGMTDTDDALAERDAGRPVAMVFPDADAAAGAGLGTIFIPNTAALIKNGPNPEGGKKLIDFLLSPGVEAKLARGPSGQVPLNPEVKVDLPPSVQPARSARVLSVDYSQAADLWDESQRFLTDLYSKR